MELVEVRTIDDLGRIVVPKKIRDSNHWGKGTEIAVCIHNDLVVLAAYEPPEEPGVPTE